MPALKRRKGVSTLQEFSVQGCGLSDAVRPLSRRRKGTGSNVYEFEMFTRRGSPDAAGGRTGDPSACLSIGHNDTGQDLRSENDSESSSKPKPKESFGKVWPGAALGEVSGIPNHGHSSGSQTRPKSKRGKILSFSECSRRNLQTVLAKVKTSASLWTMCLSLPGFVDHFTHHNVKAAFLRFGKMLTAVAARDARFAEIAGLWKQELQKRNQLHFHLIFSGITEENRELVWRWCVDHWIQCVMAIPGMPPELIASETSKMRAVHLFEGTKKEGFRDSNFQKIRGNFHSYFAKYLGKDVEAHCAESPIPGRWWGKFNARHIPFASERSIVLPERVAVHAQRVARKIRQARADNAKHTALCRRFGGMASDGKTPGISRQQLQRFYRAWLEIGGESGIDTDLPNVFRRLRAAGGSGMASGLVMFMNATGEGFRLTNFLSGYKFPAAMKFSSVRLTGAHVPGMIYEILKYAGARALVDSGQPPVVVSHRPFFHPGSIPF